MIYENENIPAETIPHYMWMQCEDGSGSLHNENQDIVVEYDMVLSNIGCILAVIRTGEIYQAAICSNYLKHLTEEEVRRIIGNPS